MTTPTEEVNRQYIKAKLSNILEPLVTEILAHKPENPAHFMINWLEDHFGRATKSSSATKEEKIVSKKPKDNESGSDSESDDDDYVEELPEIQKFASKKGPRTSVSAEAYGSWNKKEDFEPRVIEKGEDLKKKKFSRD